MSEVTILDQTFLLLPERAAFWKEKKTLIVADLHWGKTEVFRQFGVPVPEGVLRDDLIRLEKALLATQPERLLILGDLVHSARGLTETVLQTVHEFISRWQSRWPQFKIELILGNHDRGLRLPEEWGIKIIQGDLREDPFIFSHESSEGTNSGYTWAGHVHPVLKLKSRGDSLRLPCFAIGARRALLPAFSAFTGGFEIKPGSSEKVFVIAEEQIVSI